MNPAETTEQEPALVDQDKSGDEGPVFEDLGIDEMTEVSDEDDVESDGEMDSEDDLIALEEPVPDEYAVYDHEELDRKMEELTESFSQGSVGDSSENTPGDDYEPDFSELPRAVGRIDKPFRDL